MTEILAQDIIYILSWEFKGKKQNCKQKQLHICLYVLCPQPANGEISKCETAEVY